ncbi:MAG: hypothetical protein JXD22_01710 [Sedimentisphaerales bacterium]|nr:hypothetical protein [Sedimentisphaerales bacterium]
MENSIVGPVLLLEDGIPEQGVAIYWYPVFPALTECRSYYYGLWKGKYRRLLVYSYIGV